LKKKLFENQTEDLTTYQSLTASRLSISEFIKVGHSTPLTDVF